MENNIKIECLKEKLNKLKCSVDIKNILVSKELRNYYILIEEMVSLSEKCLLYGFDKKAYRYYMLALIMKGKSSKCKYFKNKK